MSKKRVLLEVDAAVLGRWEIITGIRSKADDHTICPDCKDQILFCDCADQLADGILCTARSAGVKQVSEKEAQFHNMTETLAKILIEKNKSYGDSFGISIKKYGLTAALTRISDKFNRLESLILNDTKGDSLEDTLMDLAGYCVLTLLEVQEGDE